MHYIFITGQVSTLSIDTVININININIIHDDKGIDVFHNMDPTIMFLFCHLLLWNSHTNEYSERTQSKLYVTPATKSK